MCKESLPIQKQLFLHVQSIQQSFYIHTIHISDTRTAVMSVTCLLVGPIEFDKVHPTF